MNLVITNVLLLTWAERQSNKNHRAKEYVMIHSCAWELKPNFPFQWALSCILSVVRERMQQSYALKYSVLWLSFYAWTVPYSQPNQRPQTGYFHSVVRAWKLTVVNYLSIAFQARIKITKCVESHWNARWMRAFAYIITTYNSLFRISRFFFFINGGNQVFGSSIIFFPWTVPYS